MELISTGYAITIADAAIRALPSEPCHLFITAVSATSIDVSNDPAMGNPKNLVPATDPSFTSAGTDVAAGFIRVNGGTAIVRLVKN